MFLCGRYRWPCGPRPKGPARARQIWPGPSTARPSQNRARASPTRTSCPGLGRTPRPWAGTARHGSCRPGRRRPANFHRPQPSPHTHPLQTLDLSLPDSPGRPEWRSPAPSSPQAQRPPLLVAAAPPRRLWAVASSPSPLLAVEIRRRAPPAAPYPLLLPPRPAAPRLRPAARGLLGSAPPPRRTPPPRLRPALCPAGRSLLVSGSPPRRSAPRRLLISASPTTASSAPRRRPPPPRHPLPSAASSSPRRPRRRPPRSRRRDLCCWAAGRLICVVGPGCFGLARHESGPWARAWAARGARGQARHGPQSNWAGLGTAR